MDTVIYTASPLQAFLINIIVIGFLFVVGGGGIALAVFRTKSRKNKTQENIERIGLGCASVVLLLAGALTSFVSANTFLTGDEMVTVMVDDKQIVESNCGTKKNRFRTCTSYVVETYSDQNYIDFTVTQKTWEQIEPGSCYQFTYYPPQSLLGDYLQETTTDSYESASNITRIEQVSCP
ncbi:MAG: hypothetical protein UZ14_CFX002002704 [Chloroflexi bacterium OLB14]|nr:MAG: hypothetical protein UZ14_CFX002002704 [Chloroflexi bacterium OLB14]